MKAHIFLIANPKFQVQILCSFGDIIKSVKLNGIPENNLCIFIIASSPGVHTFFCLWRVNKKLPRGGGGWNFTKCISEVKVNQLKWKNMYVKMGISIFKRENLPFYTTLPLLMEGSYCTLRFFWVGGVGSSSNFFPLVLLFFSCELTYITHTHIKGTSHNSIFQISLFSTLADIFAV